MSEIHSTEHKWEEARRRNTSRGMALVTTLLLLMVMMAMTLAMVIAVTSDSLITKYYRNAPTSFYAADSGVNIARQAMLSSLSNAAITSGQTFTSGTVPTLSSTDVSTALATVNGYTSNTSILGGQAASSWPASFKVVGSQSGTLGTTLAGCVLGGSTCTPTTPICTIGTVVGASNAQPYDCVTNPPQCTGTCAGFSAAVNYSFPYQITAIGQSIASEQQIVEDAGSLVITASFDTAQTYNQSFAAWGMFIDQYPECNGNTLVAGTISGPVFTNGAWTFGNTGSYTFTDKVGSVSSTFGWQGSSCAQTATYPQPGFSTTFQSTVSLGSNSITLPPNEFSQQNAVVDGIGGSTLASGVTMANTLQTATGLDWPTSGTPSSGVYMPYTSTTSASCPAAPCMTGGGIYVQNDADSVVLSTGNSNTQQIVTITQGNTVTTITMDLSAKTTLMSQAVTTSTTKNGKTTTTTTTTNSPTIHGVPENNTTNTEAVMLYVNGEISSLSGPSSGAAIANGSAMTIDAGAGDDITVTGNITYASEPVTMTQNQIPGTPADTLIPANNSGQVLGLFTNGGNVSLAVPNSGQNLEIDASIATIKAGGSGALINNGNSINTLTIVGGRIQNTIQNIGSTTRNVWFDRRFAQGGFAPPWFPTATVTPKNTNAVTTITPTVQRTQWLAVY